MLLKIELENKTKEQEERTKKASTGLYKPPTEEEEAKQKEADDERDKKIEDYKRLAKAKPPIKQWIRETSIHDLLISLDRMAEYDRMLADLGKMSFDNW